MDGTLRTNKNLSDILDGRAATNLDNACDGSGFVPEFFVTLILKLHEIHGTGPGLIKLLTKLLDWLHAATAKGNVQFVFDSFAFTWHLSGA